MPKTEIETEIDAGSDVEIDVAVEDARWAEVVPDLDATAPRRDVETGTDVGTPEPASTKADVESGK